MNSIVTAVLISVISTIIISLLTACVVFFKKQAKTYQGLLERERKDNLRNTVREELEPVIEEINRLQAKVERCEAKEQEDVKIILHSYKFRLIQLCQTYLRQQYLTQTQFDQLSEFYKVYHDLGGNGQAQEYYEKVMKLAIREE